MPDGLRVLVVVALLALVACRPDTVPLSYSLEPGNTFTYEVRARAEADWDIAGPGRGSYEAVFEVTEEVLSSDPEGAVVQVEMVPTSVSEEGLPSPGRTPRRFTLRMGAGGEVIEVIEVEGLPAEAVEADDLTFIGTYRPPLPDDPVRLHDAWQAGQTLEVGQLFQEIETRGELTGLRIGSDGTRVARLDYEGRGPLVWTTAFSSGSAELQGDATIATEATFAIDEGYLERAHSVTRGSFDVHVVPGGRAPPILGSLDLKVDVTLRLTNR